MQIEPYILLPIAAAFVLVVIVFIRLVAGSRNAIVSKESCTELLSYEEPDNIIENILVAHDNTAALILTCNKVPLRLVRRHGDKVVLQTLSPADIEPTNEPSMGFSIHRQDFSHPAIQLNCTPDEASTWAILLRDLSLSQLNRAS